MIISEARQGHLAQLIVDKIWHDDLVEYPDEDATMRFAKKAISMWITEQSALDEVVRAKISSLKRTLLEGTPEWDVMYGKYYEEELRRHGK